jgi:NTP pyrophosphatase (non-canonical NTP hydrolase)
VKTNKKKKAGPFSIGSDIWPGISKLVEEAGEVSQVCGKLIGTGGEAIHYDGKNLRDRLEEEIADLMAACTFVIEANDLDYNRVADRSVHKMSLFRKWHEEQGK